MRSKASTYFQGDTPRSSYYHASTWSICFQISTQTLLIASWQKVQSCRVLRMLNPHYFTRGRRCLLHCRRCPKANIQSSASFRMWPKAHSHSELRAGKSLFFPFLWVNQINGLRVISPLNTFCALERFCWQTDCSGIFIQFTPFFQFMLWMFIHCSLGTHTRKIYPYLYWNTACQRCRQTRITGRWKECWKERLRQKHSSAGIFSLLGKWDQYKKSLPLHMGK